jgi:hypothetical protein
LRFQPRASRATARIALAEFSIDRDLVSGRRASIEVFDSWPNPGEQSAPCCPGCHGPKARGGSELPPLARGFLNPANASRIITGLTQARDGTGLDHIRRTTVFRNLVRGCVAGRSDGIEHFSTLFEIPTTLTDPPPPRPIPTCSSRSMISSVRYLRRPIRRLSHAPCGQFASTRLVRSKTRHQNMALGETGHRNVASVANCRT